MIFRDLILGDALELLIDNRGKNPPYADEGIPTVSGMSVRPGMLDLSESRFVSVETWKRWMPSPTRSDDVIMTSEAPLGRVALVGTDQPILLAQRVFGLRGREQVLSSRFLYYSLQTKVVQADLASRATGSTVLGIRQPELRRVRIPAPSYPDQVAIAAVLSALDEKISLNLEIATNSVELADCLFVTAKAAGTFTTATFGEIATIGGGGTPRTSVERFWGGSVPWATPTDVTALPVPYLDRTSRTITRDGLASISSDLYPMGSILMTSRATIGSFATARVPIAVNQGFIVVNAKNRDLQWWLFHDMRSRVGEFLSYANGATFLELPKGKLRNLSVSVPDSVTAASFDREVGALHNLAADRFVQSRQLAATRDELLPLLMTGKITIRDAESVVEEVI